jgi:hypothetical protein
LKTKTPNNMPALFLYLLQVNVGLVLFYLAYHLVLRQTTFHAWNRLFLMAGILLSAALPLVDVSPLLAKNDKVYQTISVMSFEWAAPARRTAPTATSFDFWLVPVGIFWLGVLVMTVRLVVQGTSLYRIHRRSRPASYQGMAFREIEADLPPFSFGNTIYFNPTKHPEQAWRGILQHEYTHVQQAHTLDILLAEFTTVFLWFNPVVWRWRAALKQNLEFLTDQQTLQAGIDRKQYQFSLVQTTTTLPLTLASAFSYPSLKQRIMMMNQHPSAKVQRLRFLATLPLLVLFLLGFQGIASSSSQWEGLLPQKTTQDGQKAYEAFLKRNPTVKGLRWSNGQIAVVLKSGETETYPNTPAGVAQLEKKYGSLPTPPPPPPPPAAPPAAPAAALAPPPPPPPMNVTLTKEFKQRNPTVKGISAASDGLYVILKSGEVESFDNTADGRAAFEKKYGTLPPPPPPVMRSKEDLPPPPPPVRKN